MITDAQFIEAMELAVKEKGCENVAPGTYRTGYTGEAYCIVGYALFKISEDLCPMDNNLMADNLLTELGCSMKVAWSALAAQCANDRGMIWGDALTIFRWGLENFDHYPVTPYGRREFLDDGMHVGRRIRAMERGKQAGCIGVPKVSQTEQIAVQNWAGACVASMDICVNDTIVAMNGFAAAFSNVAITPLTITSVLVKKDHALTA